MQALTCGAFLPVAELRLSAARIRLQPLRTGLGLHLHSRRKELGQSQREAALSFGVTPGTYCQWENGEYEPKPKQWPGIIEYLGVDPICPVPGTIGEHIGCAQRRLGFTRTELARRIGATRYTLRAWENGTLRTKREAAISTRIKQAVNSSYERTNEAI